MGNKRTKHVKNAKGSGSIVDGTSISEMSREQLEPFVLRIQRELEREREERNFFQMERDKIKIFWEITRQQLQENRSALRNKEKQNEKISSQHQLEIKTHRQKIKHLLYSQHGRLSELKVENILILRNTERDLADEEFILLNENRTLKSLIGKQNETQKNEIQSLFFENIINISKVRTESEKQYRILERKYGCYLQQIKDEMDLKNEIITAKVQQRKNDLLKHLIEKQANIHKRMNEFFTNIIAENLALVAVLKAKSRSGKIDNGIGDGAHGHVLKAFSIKRNKWMALKKIRMKKNEIEISPSEMVLREIKVLLIIDCKYVMQLLDYFSYKCDVVLAFEFMPTGLWEILYDLWKPPNISTIKSYMRMLLKGVGFLHGMGIMHRDLKPANLLISYDGILKIADLGLSRTMWCAEEKGRPYTHQVATRWYRAPELLYGSRFYDQSVDLWAVGCILAEMLTKTPLFPGENDIEQLAVVIHNLGTPTLQIWPSINQLPDYNKITFPLSSGKPFEHLVPEGDDIGLDLIKSFLHYDGKKRTTAKKALNHAYFFKTPLPCLEREMSLQIENHRDTIKHQLENFKIYENCLDNVNLFLSS